MTGQVDGGHLQIGDLDTLWVFVFIQLGAYLETSIGCRRSDQLDDRAIASQWLASPVDRDERKKAVLDLVPLARAGWQVANRDGELELIGQLLKLDFPETHTMSVAAATVSGDHQTFGFGMTLPSHRPPPSADRVDGKGGGVVIRSDADPADVVVDVIHAVWHRALQLGINEVMHIDLFGSAFGPPFAARILEIAYQFLLFRIDRDDRLAVRQKTASLLVDVFELTIRSICSLPSWDFRLACKL